MFNILIMQEQGTMKETPPRGGFSGTYLPGKGPVNQ